MSQEVQFEAVPRQDKHVVLQAVHVVEDAPDATDERNCPRPHV